MPERSYILTKFAAGKMYAHLAIGHGWVNNYSEQTGCLAWDHNVYSFRRRRMASTSNRVTAFVMYLFRAYLFYLLSLRAFFLSAHLLYFLISSYTVLFFLSPFFISYLPFIPRSLSSFLFYLNFISFYFIFYFLSFPLVICDLHQCRILKYWFFFLCNSTTLRAWRLLLDPFRLKTT
jgi:hypothetical protein